MKPRISPFLVLVAVMFAAVFLCVDSGNAGQVRVGIGFSIPPYVIREKEAGLEVDVIREAFRAAGHEVAFVYLPNLRLPLAFAQEEVDCIAVNASYDLSGETASAVYDSEETIVLRNYAVHLLENRLTIECLGDLAECKVLAFDNAVKYLGADFAAMALSNEHYGELADQALQVRMLYSKRVEVVISDRRIFHYWRRQLLSTPDAQAVNLNQRVVFSPIFPPSPRHVVFSDNVLRDRFNAGLEGLRASGEFDKIVQRYAGVEYEGGF